MGYAIQPQEMPGNNITRSRSPLPTTYTLHGETLEAVASARYLGVDIANDLSWKTHVSRIINNANKSLGFLRRNLKTKKKTLLRENAYKAIVRPQLEYASPVCDPHTKDDIQKIECPETSSSMGPWGLLALLKRHRHDRKTWMAYA